jgi:hypothetical protein
MVKVKRTLWPWVLSVLFNLANVIVCHFSYGHCHSLSFLFWPFLLSVLFLMAIVIVCPKWQTITMAIRKMTDNNNGHKKGQTITMVKVKRTDNNNGHKKRTAIVLVCPFYFDHCYCLSFLFWPLLLSVLFILAIVIVCPFSDGHCYYLSFLFWPLLLIKKGQTITMAIRKRTDNKNGQNKNDRLWQWP